LTISLFDKFSKRTVQAKWLKINQLTLSLGVDCLTSMEKSFTVEQVKSALLAIRSKISDQQMAMLRGFYVRPVASMETIASFGGYGTYNNGNGIFGRLCHWIADELGFEPESGSWTSTIASGAGEFDLHGHFQWRLDTVVAEALEQTGWLAGLSGSTLFAKKPITDDETVVDLGEVTETERQALIRARVGQGIFRAEVIAVWQRCSVTGCRIEKLLIASHLVPWKLATNAERLDKFNGLLLTPNLDKLVDCCLIAFNDDGSILISKDLSIEEQAILGVSEKSKLRFVRPAMLPYLQRHRALFWSENKQACQEQSAGKRRII